MSPEPSSWLVRRQPSRPRPSPGPVQPRHAAGAAHEVRAGALPVERASHGEGTGRTASAGLDCDPSTGSRFVHRWQGRQRGACRPHTPVTAQRAWNRR